MFLLLSPFMNPVKIFLRFNGKIINVPLQLMCISTGAYVCIGPEKSVPLSTLNSQLSRASTLPFAHKTVLALPISLLLKANSGDLRDRTQSPNRKPEHNEGQDLVFG